MPRGTYAFSAYAPEGGRTITGVTLSTTANHAIRTSTGKGDVRLSGR